MTEQQTTTPGEASAPGPSGPVADHPDPTARQQVSAYMRGSVANMLRSLVVIGAIMALMMIMYPRIQPDYSGVDVLQTARQVEDSTGWPVSAPQGLGEGWVQTRAEYRRATDQLMTWHAGFESPQGGFVALNQTVDATDAWVAQQVNQTPQVGETEIAGETWQQYAREGSRVQRSLVRPGDSGQLTTVVTGNASWEQLAEFVAALEPVAATS